MEQILQTFSDRKGELWSALLQHLQISTISLLIAMVIAIPLAIWVVKHTKLAEFLLQLTGVLQTLPSLAVLGLLIPIVGIGTVPAVIALVVYALLPIFQNTYLGLTEIDPALEEAADAFGMSRMKKLFRLELPLAMPTIISGIRTALVMIIGTATLAALIGAGGLGTFILLGIDRNNTSLILIGAIASGLLAIIMSALIKWLEHASVKTAVSVLALIVVLLGGGSAYNAYVNRTETITIAGKLGSEPEILINMYKELITNDDSHIKVTLKPNFGKTTFLFNAVKNDQIDIYPEFTGTVLETLAKKPQKTTGLTAQATYRKAKTTLAKQDELALLKPMKYNNSYALAVPEKFQQEHKLKTISDLQNVQSLLKGGMTLEFIDRGDGLKGIKQTYGLDFPVKSMEPALRYQAIGQKKINIVDAYSTDSELRQYHLGILKDDKRMFPTYQGAPLMKQKFADDHPQIVKSLNKLAGKITEKQMQEMNYEVNVQDKSPATVAHNYLSKHHLLKEGD
ncbi:glycine betaine/carnitine/choline ABC transporter substrate-binding and permease protein [Ligilactobacillus salitolerans]|uniref:Glycine betaine/carnitine/choline ABC transporter substrate-binding and permease protein n=1 Tax=Ligilactobacillus salitolerans TaxID=1808352 RepID=A0A401IPV5_9LACO|nr:ABC transporter permease/substrate-binding protein [Ligilactobacillus salitolerans]GBG93562.1 glycine betaine/carnitine/choline ABC transporter substrate-binding and permease protein [Ligilactobacillus salitolerans]